MWSLQRCRVSAKAMKGIADESGGEKKKTTGSTGAGGARGRAQKAQKVGRAERSSGKSRRKQRKKQGEAERSRHLFLVDYQCSYGPRSYTS